MAKAADRANLHLKTPHPLYQATASAQLNAQNPEMRAEQAGMQEAVQRAPSEQWGASSGLRNQKGKRQIQQLARSGDKGAMIEYIVVKLFNHIENASIQAK
jgi:hypothetical protein